jgi:hypothetical protein
MRGQAANLSLRSRSSAEQGILAMLGMLGLLGTLSRRARTTFVARSQGTGTPLTNPMA